jgi:hypothetical protein
MLNIAQGNNGQLPVATTQQGYCVNNGIFRKQKKDAFSCVLPKPFNPARLKKFIHYFFSYALLHIPEKKQYDQTRFSFFRAPPVPSTFLCTFYKKVALV